MSYPKPLRRLIVLLAKLPGVGEKTATRLAFHMLKMTPESVRELGESIAAVPNAVIHCSRCFNIADQDPCTICADPARRDDLLCVVENPTDLVPIEKSGEYRGRYHVLGGAISPIDGVMPEDLRVRELLERISAGGMGLNGAGFASYGSEKKGTPVKAFVRICEANDQVRVNSPVEEPHVLAIFHEALAKSVPVTSGAG